MILLHRRSVFWLGEVSNMTSYRRHDAQVSQQWGHVVMGKRAGNSRNCRGVVGQTVGGQGSEGRAHCAQSGASY